MRTRCSDRGGRRRERVSTRADVNKPRSGASTALTILGIFRSGADRCVAAAARVVKSGDVVKETDSSNRSHKIVQIIHSAYINTTRPVLHYVRGSRRCSLRHRIPLPTGNTRRERATTSRCSVHRPAPRGPAACPSPPRASPTATTARRARPTSGESRCRHKHEQNVRPTRRELFPTNFRN